MVTWPAEIVFGVRDQQRAEAGGRIYLDNAWLSDSDNGAQVADLFDKWQALSAGHLIERSTKLFLVEDDGGGDTEDPYGSALDQAVFSFRADGASFKTIQVVVPAPAEIFQVDSDLVDTERADVIAFIEACLAIPIRDEHGRPVDLFFGARRDRRRRAWCSCGRDEV